MMELFGADWISTVYEALRVATRDKPLDRSALDRVFEAYRASELAFRKAFEDFDHHSNNLRVRMFRPFIWKLIEVVAILKRRRGTWA